MLSMTPAAAAGGVLSNKTSPAFGTIPNDQLPGSDQFVVPAAPVQVFCASTGLAAARASRTVAMSTEPCRRVRMSEDRVRLMINDDAPAFMGFFFRSKQKSNVASCHALAETRQHSKARLSSMSNGFGNSNSL